MRKVLILFLFSSSIAYGQINPPKYNATSTYSLTDTIRNYNIRERLVQLATNNPSYEITDRLANVAAYQIRIAKGNWLATISAQYNANDYTLFKHSNTSNAIYYPQYNFGISLPFDLFTKNINTVKIARETYLIAQATKNEKFREIKALVLTSYEDYLLSRQKLEFQIQMTQEAFDNYKIAEDAYRKNLIKAEDLSKAYRNWVAEQILKLDLQRNLNVTKIEVEKIIGVKLDDVLKENL